MIKKLALKVLSPGMLKHLRAIDNYYNGDEELRYLKALCDPDKTAIDIGANIGVYTYFMLRHSSHVYAYEPVPSLVGFLKQSFGKGVTVRDAAVSNQTGTARLVIPVLAGGREMHELSSIEQEFGDEAQTHAVDVPTVRLDDEDVGTVGVIKIEVQQHEKAVLEGARDTLERDHPNLIVAWAPLLSKDGVHQDFALLFELGYTGYFTFDHRVLPLEQFDPEVHANPGKLGQPGEFMNTNLVFSTSLPGL